MTLDAKHQQMLQTMADKRLEKEESQAILAELYTKRDALNDEIAFMLADGKTDTIEWANTWTIILDVKDSIRLLEQELEEVDGDAAQVEYYADTGNILFQYYDLLKNQENSAPPAPPPPKNIRSRKKTLPLNTRSILETLFAEPVVIQEAGADVNIVLSTTSLVGTVDKGALVDKYLTVVDPTHVRRTFVDMSSEFCTVCQIPLICMYQDGIMYCTQCGYQELLLVEQNRPVYRQPTKEASHFSYKRINHFNEWLAQIQGKESTDIPDEIFDRILAEIRKEKITDPSKITYNKMREICKKLKINKFYEHIPYIINRINNLPTPHFPPELEEKLRAMFKEIQGPFLKHCPKNRKNFLSYSYVLYKFFQLLEKDEYLGFCFLLKSREKLSIQDQIWKDICAELKWDYICSI